MPSITAEGVEYSYFTPSEEVHALRGVDLHVEPGGITCLFGASGSGKSTLLTLLAGLDVPRVGTVEVLGRSLETMTEKARAEFRLHHIGLVFQEHNLVPQLSARENVEILLSARGVADATRVALEALDAVGLAKEAARRPAELSGGQRQRVGIARALAGKRSIVLCDEPTGALDSTNARHLFAILAERAKSDHVAVLIATHDERALEYASSEVVMVDGAIARRRELSPRA